MKLNIQDKFLQRDGRVFLTGMEAIVRLVREKQELDRAAATSTRPISPAMRGRRWAG